MRRRWRSGFSPPPRTTLKTSWLQRGGARPPASAPQPVHVDRSSMSHPRQISRQTSTRNKIAELGSGTADTISVLAHLENLMTRGLVGSDSRSAPERVYFLRAYWGGSCDPTHSLAPPLAPSFEHEHVPYQVLPVAPSIEMVLPVLSNPSGIEQIGFAQASFNEKLPRPFAEGPAPPLGQRIAKSQLWTVSKVPLYMTIEDLSQQPLTL